MTFTRTTRTLATILALGAIGCSSGSERQPRNTSPVMENLLSRPTTSIPETPVGNQEYANKQLNTYTLPKSTKARYFSQPQSAGDVGTTLIAGKSLSTAAGDLNGDGIIDLIIAGPTNEIKYFEGTPEGKFIDRGAVGRFNMWNEQHGSVVLADVNHDGLLDIIAAEAYGSINVYINTIPQKDKLADIRKKP